MQNDQSLSLSSFFESSYLPLRMIAASPRSIEEYRSAVRILTRYFSRTLLDAGTPARPPRLSDLSDELLAGAMAWQIRRGRSRATANKLYRSIKAIWRFARRRKLIESAPDIDPLDEFLPEPLTWTLEDYNKILDQANGLRGAICGVPAHLFWRALILTIVNTGGRITAIMRIKTADVDLPRNEVLLRGANQKQRADQRFELQPAVRAAIEATLAGQEPRIWLFPWPYDRGNEGRQWQTLRRQYKRLLRGAGLPISSKHLFHNLRRFTATILADARGEEFARDYLGHSHVSVTRRYLDRTQMRSRRSGVAHLPEPPSAPTIQIHQPPAEPATVASRQRLLFG